MTEDSQTVGPHHKSPRLRNTKEENARTVTRRPIVCKPQEAKEEAGTKLPRQTYKPRRPETTLQEQRSLLPSHPQNLANKKKTERNVFKVWRKKPHLEFIPCNYPSKGKS